MGCTLAVRAIEVDPWITAEGVAAILTSYRVGGGGEPSEMEKWPEGSRACGLAALVGSVGGPSQDSDQPEGNH